MTDKEDMRSPSVRGSADASQSTVWRVPHPFVLEDFHGIDEDGPYETKSWRPGVRFEDRGPDDADAVADGVGEQIITEVARFKPGKFPVRVFFTREWVAPNGHKFGKPRLHVKSAAAFTALVRGYRHRYELASASEHRAKRDHEP